jgi:hypothetical protein
MQIGSIIEITLEKFVFNSTTYTREKKVYQTQIILFMKPLFQKKLTL